jgi:hypothetical protein
MQNGMVLPGKSLRETQNILFLLRAYSRAKNCPANGKSRLASDDRDLHEQYAKHRPQVNTLLRVATLAFNPIQT